MGGDGNRTGVSEGRVLGICLLLSLGMLLPRAV